jgi:serine/threonine protein kinase
VLLSDFGVAVALLQTMTHLSVHGFAGTPTYAAPEQFQNKASIASDQYALAVVAYEWLTGVAPFRGEWWVVGTEKVTKNAPPLRDKVPTLAPALEEVVLKALARDPKERHKSVMAFAAALEAASKPPAR